MPLTMNMEQSKWSFINPTTNFVSFISTADVEKRSINLGTRRNKSEDRTSNTTFISKRVLSPTTKMKSIREIVFPAKYQA